MNYIKLNNINPKSMNRFLIFILTAVLCPFVINAQTDETKPMRVSKAVAFAKSAPLAELAAVLSPDKSESITIKEVKNKLNYEKWPDADPMRSPGKVQTKMGARKSRGPIAGFPGQGFTGVHPPDTDGDVSETHFVQVVNSKYNVYDKNGTKLLGPLNLSTLWSDLPGPWSGSNDGDPIVVYDEESERWIITQFSVNTPTKYELFAVSETSDPLGSYYLYSFSFGNYMNDYPKIGVWNDAYYATYNLFYGGFVGAQVTAVDRAKMLVGDPDASMIEFRKNGYYSIMPADIDGEVLPDVGTPCPLMYINNSQQVEMWDFHVDWDNPTNSTLTLGSTINVSSFSSLPNTNNGNGGFVTQPGTSQRLDGLGNMIMNRLAYRNFTDHESMVVTHSIIVSTGSGVPRAAIRWYEFRRPGGVWELYQEGTYSPDDNHRWMGSAAINVNGDIAIAYSVSNSTDIYPSIRYTGRNADDLLGEMTIDEVELKTGTSSQEHWRWGDYACLNVDPADDTTFWFTTEYSSWKTWIASFDLDEILGPSCFAGADSSACQNGSFATHGSGTGVHQIQWTTSGDGYFFFEDQYIAMYVRGPQDIIDGGCSLILNVTGFDGGTASDSMYLSIVDSPTCNAGDDAALYEGESYTLQGTASHYGSIIWTTEGDGIFSDPTILNAIYTPGTNDIALGGVELNLHAEPILPCEGSDDDEVYIGLIAGVDNKDTKSTKLSLYPNPTVDVFTMNIDGLTPGEQFKFFVFTSNSKEVYRQVVKANSNTYERVIDMSEFIPGIYFVSVVSEKGITTMKIIKK
jgi:type IX secretion system substrate protein